MKLFGRGAKAPDGPAGPPPGIDLETELRTLALIRAHGHGDVYWGAPTRCPACGIYGLVEEVDRAKGTTVNRCMSQSCGERWELSRYAVRELKRRIKAGEVVSPDRFPDRKGGTAAAVDPLPPGTPLADTAAQLSRDGTRITF